ncbi:hypothetical protein RSWS8N_03985 [Cereibacter sphaeroides WS8N]|uniref:helix-turn-helix domain-containing protein n=1 Tax=Cereibacter sphaeroides TaxID=1063 RepID=UPI00020DF6C4|nr:helix-turn-helix domain-containing protein [Cereibacter sphaeroides]EGJ21209.1 hypothetical protein RSWS8N_03985 [Cereibacter sphaeroides WS8N]
MSVDRKPERSPFDKERDAFLLEVSANRKLSAAAKSIAIQIAVKHANRMQFNNGAWDLAWPSFETLAEATGYQRNAVIVGVNQLATEGHLDVRRQKGGSGRSNRYRWIIKGTVTIDAQDAVDDGENSIVDDTVSDENSIVEDTRTVSSTIPEPLEEPLGGAGAHAPALEPPKTAPSPDTVESLNNVQDASAGARDRARSDDVQGRDHPASDPDMDGRVFDLVPEYAPADGIAQLPVLRRGQHISLAERDALSAGWHGLGPSVSPPDAVEEDGPLPTAVAAAAFARLHRDLGDAEAFAADVLDGFAGGDGDAAARAARIAAKVLRQAVSQGTGPEVLEAP